MTVYYPQAMATLSIIWENFGDKSNLLAKQKHDLTVEVRRARVKINNYTQADEFELDIDYKVFPFDPRSIRSCAVVIHAENLEKAYEGSTLKRIVPSVENALCYGFVDDESISLDETTRTVSLKGRDLTSIFADVTWPRESLPLNKPLNLVIAQLIGRLKGAKDITVENRTGEVSLPVLAKFYPDFGQLSGKRNARKKETYWDVIQDIVGKSGFIAYMELDKLVLTKPRTLYEKSKAVKFIYGHNLKSLELKRNLGLQKGFNVRVRSFISTTKKIEEANIPQDSTKLPNRGQEVTVPKQTRKGDLIENAEETAPYLTFSVSNVASRAHLIEIGEQIFEEMSRQQIEGRFTTYEMEAPQGNAACFDLLKLRNGTAVSVEIGVDDLRQIQQLSTQAERYKYLLRRCYPAQIATIFAETMGAFSTFFYTRSVDYEISSETGLRVDVDFVNFIDTSNKGFGL